MLLENIDKSKPIHMIGIGGTSMSGIAEIILNMGFKVTGSDITLSKTTSKLEKSGIKVFQGHNADNIKNACLVVYTAAIKQDNPELVHAKELNIPTMERSEFLGEITKLYNKTVSVCGTHGKTTTTSMISLIFMEAQMDPTIQVGADIRQLGNQNYRVGKSPYFILESCEYVRSFLQFKPHTVVLLNVEEDHLDYYKDIDDIKSAFREFVSYAPKDGLIVVNSDNPNSMDVLDNAKAKIITVGIKNENADYIANNISLDENTSFYSFDVCFKNEKFPIKLSIPGYHNIYNALCAIATSIEHGIDIKFIQKALSEYTGASRRFEYVGTINGAKIFDDYAHHPTEIKATLEAASKMKYNKLWVVFQPHTYSRTKALFNEFVNTFELADNIIILDIYAAREKDDKSINSKMLVDEINKKHNNCIYISSLEETKEYLLENVQVNDLILTIGAGTVTKIGYMLINHE